MSVHWAVVGGEGEVVQQVEGGHHQGQAQLHQPSVEDHLPVVNITDQLPVEGS